MTAPRSSKPTRPSTTRSGRTRSGTTKSGRIMISATPQPLPAALGYRMPAEWEPHESTWLAWPHLRDDWPGKFEAIPWVYAEIIRNLARHERVDLIVNDASSEKKGR